MRSHKMGRVLSKEQIEEVKREVNIDEAAAQKPVTVNVPTMQVGYNSNGTIKEVQVKSLEYEIDGKTDKNNTVQQQNI